MKNKMIFKIAALFTLVFFLSNNTLSAQSLCGGYTVDNNITCPVKVKIGRLCNGAPCGGAITVNLTPAGTSGAQYIIPSCCGGSGCSYDITLLEVNGTALAFPPTVNPSSPFINTTTICLVNPITMDYQSGYTKIED